MSQPEIRQTASRLVYENRWMRVREDAIERSDGSSGLYSVVEKSDFAVIAAVQDGHLYLVEQYRYPIGKRCWELPMGAWEGQDIDPLTLACAELREETGLVAQHMEHAGRLNLAPGYSSQGYDIFLATGLTQQSRALDAEEQGLIVQAFAIDTVLTMICEQVITDATTVATFGLLRLKGAL